MSRIDLPDGMLGDATQKFADASTGMLTGNKPRPTSGFGSVTGIAADVDLYLRGMSVARAALADASKTAGRAARDLMERSAALDKELAASLSSGYAVKGAS